MAIAYVTGSVAPYHHRLFDAYGKTNGADLRVFQCAVVEPGRKWKTPAPQNYQLTLLKGYGYHVSDVRHYYFNPDVLWRLTKLAPECVVIDSFSPTMLAAAQYGFATGTPVGFCIEGARDMDPGETSWPHRRARRWVASRAKFALCTSRAAMEMMEHWGLKPGAGTFVPHFGAWDAPSELRDFDQRNFDILVCGTLNTRKNPLFVADVVDRLVADGFRPKVRIVGDGALREPLAKRFADRGVEAQFDGYLQPAGIIEAYQSAKLLLFPTLTDTWGLVANEAMLCGTPVLASRHAVSSRELVEVYGTGLVRDLDPDLWARSVREMLSSKPVWQGFQRRRAEAMSWFCVDQAVAGFKGAIEKGRSARRPQAISGSARQVDDADRASHP